MKHPHPPFHPSEMEVIREHLCGITMGTPDFPSYEPIFNRPITAKENFRLAFSGEKPYWLPITGWAYCDVNNFRPRIIQDNIATHSVMDGEDNFEYGANTALGWFNLEWVYVPVAEGATVKPGSPLVEDMNDWEKYIVWPDLDHLDWKGMGERNKEYLDTPQLNQLGIGSGFWERLISLMDVGGAAMALIDDNQKDAVKAFFDRYADFLIDYIRHTKEVCDIDCVMIHDDWGTQNGPFFSLETAREMLLPYIKRIIDYIHSEGMYYEQHSCGNCTKLVPAYIEAGVDFWNPQPMNDLEYITDLCKESGPFIALPDVSLPADAPEEEIRRLAREFFDHYRGRKVFFAPWEPNFTFIDELYRYSRQEFAK